MLISRGCSWVSMKRGGCKFGDSKTRGCPWPKRGGCSFAVGTQPQRVSAPPPPPPPRGSRLGKWKRTRNTGGKHIPAGRKENLRWKWGTSPTSGYTCSFPLTPICRVTLPTLYSTTCSLTMKPDLSFWFCFHIDIHVILSGLRDAIWMK